MTRKEMINALNDPDVNAMERKYVNYYSVSTLKELLSAKRANDCIINTMFSDSDNASYHRAVYCVKNCNFKCHRGMEYKRI